LLRIIRSRNFMLDAMHRNSISPLIISAHCPKSPIKSS
jgi:hypothetical protein